MSDPVTNIEIEDVLSSIRRLVSEGERPTQASVVAENPEKNPSERLVLTSALRVGSAANDADHDDADGGVQDDAVLDQPESRMDDGQHTDDSPRTGSRADRASLEATIAELEAAVNQQADDWEPDGSETDTAPSWDNAVFSSVNTVRDADDDASAENDVSARDVAETGFSDLYIPKLDEPTADDIVDISENVSGDDTESDVQQATDDEVDNASDTSATDQGYDDQDLPEGLAEALADTPAQEKAPQSDAATTTFQHLRQSEGKIDPAAALLGAAQQPATEDEALHAYLDDGSAIDEDALRKLVLEIVRQELQGKLGERITRNVRKLVRREIMRVLNSQDVD